MGRKNRSHKGMRRDSKTPKVACPRCGKKQPEQNPNTIYFCSGCSGMFDSTPDEGGDYSSRNPAERLEREERKKR